MLDSELAELKRVGVIDIGSNSVRLVVFDGAARSPAYFFNEKVMCQLGRGLAQTGVLFPKGRKRALAAMARFAALARSFQVQSMTAVATAAVREAEDGQDFCDEVFATTGIEVTVATGLEEARFAAQGVLLGWPEADGLVADLGGSSMELAEVSGGQVGARLTSPLAPLRLADVKGSIDDYTRPIMEQLRTQVPGTYKTVYLVGGSFRAIAKLDMARRNYPLRVLHEYKVNRAELTDLLDWVHTTDLGELQALSTTSTERLRLVPLAACVLRHLVEVFEPEEAAISSFGLREGLLYERMSTSLRLRDPLLEACAFMERTSARFPGFGAELAAWVTPLLPAKRGWERIVMAAAMLHDVSWRSDPSSRAEECFDNASRGNLSGLDHPGRVLLAMALLHRYRKSGKMRRYKALKALLNKEQRSGAQVIGQAMRLGATLAGGDPGILAQARLTVEEGWLSLELAPQISQLGGETVALRLAELADSMGLEPKLTTG